MAHSLLSCNGIPNFNPLSIKDSNIKRTKAGPEPTKAVAASMFFSGSSTYLPTWLINSLTSGFCSLETSAE
ncbi:hypothetical protein WN66_01763 [Saccharomyces cerevisiae]|uniref:Putative uncharacterized protein YER023C-A n=2 Tax=Saccharomyces cerevisiae TaxID=4932 RepID=YE023_YEAST|nr:RecName: Full=Putative uncharacterized protein YER023C-A [Saccharomyces cerevisiae S288C]AAL79259.1 unknown [Saccharomyces cerevisiae]KZV11775.1 hypothetical protein WN66_01763 [Saccharomyces cerevisiae]WNV72436.1 hypothetical protein O6U65_0751 [Saccharomyces cerevisiae synthetic construct]CAY79191.1 EC1118_1E8_1233p [Saccharomyces cerevisiae EC1118]